MKFTPILAVACALALVCPAASAQTVTKLRFESTFPAASLFFENSKYFTERVKAMTGGRLQIDMLPPGISDILSKAEMNARYEKYDLYDL